MKFDSMDLREVFTSAYELTVIKQLFIFLSVGLLAAFPRDLKETL
ncbi:hypothetical protein [Methanosarcina sp.]|nr:hypothetical protein [Methanosarcina sp.]MDW5549929.1 hypothetical protein [Methanosarcina sp.]MDW5552533.1 hypothetical protein [Methanosarcina sp.]